MTTVRWGGSDLQLRTFLQCKVMLPSEILTNSTRTLSLYKEEEGTEPVSVAAAPHRLRAVRVHMRSARHVSNSVSAYEAREDALTPSANRVT